MTASPLLEFRVLGEQAVLSRGEPRPLPPSKKARALLAYLAVTAREHRRERLCSLLWDVADDPRAALRWCLTKLRDVVDDRDQRRLRADREHVTLDVGGDVLVDALEVKRRASRVDQATPAELEAALALFRGEFLEGIELTDFPAFHAWCVAERQELRIVRARLAAALLERSGAGPEQAIAVARQLVDLDPSDRAAGARLLELLRGRWSAGAPIVGAPVTRATIAPSTRELPARDALHLAPEPGACRQPGGAPAGDCDAAGPRTSAPEPPPARRTPDLVGRDAELERVRALLADPAPRVRALLLAGDPGIGKSTLLDAARSEAAARGLPALAGRAREVDAGWPFAPWLDVVRAAAVPGLDPDLAVPLAPLLEVDGGPSHGPTAREGVLRAVAALLRRRSDVTGRLLLALDDVQWLDESSVALLGVVLADARARPLRVLLAGRSGELADNPAALRALRALRREGLLEELVVGPLSPEELSRLVSGLPGGADAAGLFAESGGNPLYALELARAPRERGTVPRGLAQVVRDRLSELARPLADVLRWAAALGPCFEPEPLAAVVALSPGALVNALEALERHGWIRPARETGESACRYAFSHDVVHRAVYDELSEPRRRLMHARVAAALAARPGADGTAAAELARHAALGGDVAMAARACLAAGSRCLRLFAVADAVALARRGLAYAESLPDPDRTTLSLDLLYLSFQARRPQDAEEPVAQLTALTRCAIELGDLQHARLGCHLRAALMFEEGQVSDVERYSLEAERVSRSAAPAERVVALGEAAHCLVTIERDLPFAEALLLEADALATREGVACAVVRLAAGDLRLHRGEHEAAAELLEQARALALRDGDRLREFYSVEALAQLALERGRLSEAAALAESLVSLGERSGEGSEAPFARALVAVVLFASSGEPRAEGLDGALAAVVAADAKHRAAFLYSRTAEVELARGAAAPAAAHASQAMELAEAIDSPSESAVAAAALLRAASAKRDRSEVERARRALAAVATRHVSAYARRAIERARQEGGPAAEPARKERGDGARHRGARVRPAGRS